MDLILYMLYIQNCIMQIVLAFSINVSIFALFHCNEFFLKPEFKLLESDFIISLVE